jgi:2-oxo-4-hydroxy-4-carboxy-5-ureidoimidazoline decarboxylase
MTLTELNKLTRPALKEELRKCCGSSAWVEKMVEHFPFISTNELFENAEKIGNNLSKSDWLEAFEHHPKIGDIDSLKKKFSATAHWASGEQAAVQQTSQQTLEALAEGNEAYENKFGYIFIVCATGKSAEEMLSLLQSRLKNDPGDELKIAAAEQGKITQLRLQKLLA